MFRKIRYVTQFVSDQDKALDFYTSIFGFQKRVDARGPDYRFLTIALKDQGTEVLLWRGAAGQATGTLGTAQATSKLGTLIIESDDIRSDFAELKARGVQFVEPEPQAYPFGTRISAVDPDGNPVALLQPRR